MSTSRTRWLIFYAAAAAAVLIVLATVELPQDSQLWLEINNFGHTPLFGIMSLALLGFFRRFFQHGLPVLFQYCLSAAIAFGLGTIIELSQIPGPRDADLIDLVRNAAGIISFLSLRLAFDNPYWHDQARPWWRRRILWGLTGLVILLGSALRVGLWAMVYSERDNQFPIICDFESCFGNESIATRYSDLEVVAPPSEWTANQSAHAGLVTFYPNHDYPGLEITDPWPDWRNFSYFTFSAYSLTDSILTLSITIEDELHNFQLEDRFTGRLQFRPGSNRIEVSLDRVRTAPLGRTTDLSRIARIKLYLYQPNDSVKIYLDEFGLR